MTEIDYACGTHVGLVREINEDAFFADPQLGLWVVADGMGGHMAGEVASGIVIRDLPRCITRGDSLSDAIEMVHSMIQIATDEGQGAKHMGSTVVALKLDGSSYQIAWVGDSRAYLWDGLELHQLTKDHSYVQLLLEMGLIMESELFDHPSRNVISQGLGVGGAEGGLVKVDTVTGKLNPGDSILLCTDGLCGGVRDARIDEIMGSTENSQERVDRLIEAALAAGGKDNITVIVLSARIE
ncbi:MAG: protein phosphatase 2C domain-containing protein [Methylococcaceae bacterium]|nr:protein phosphatase 2C domain-containing protein [Methylococcaceae bacterium]